MDEQTQIFSQEILERISEEEESLTKTLSSLEKSLIDENQKLFHHSKEARDLTSQLVNTQRDTDKQLLANDEAIAHKLSQRAKESSSSIEKLINSPYFGRIVIEEETPRGIKTSEYKIGKYTNLEANILDWKTSPLARIFYEYEEGEEFLEEIRDRERSGLLKKRTKVKIENSTLLQFSCGLGNFEKKDSTWIQGGRVKGSKTGQFTLPDILSLITAEQFRLITENADKPVILHGVAGSGKTSVALHRLAWQLEQDLSAKPLVLAPTKLLCSYVENSLNSLEVKKEIPILTIKKWIDNMAIDEGLWDHYKKIGILPPPHIARLKSSPAFVRTLVEIQKEKSGTYTDLILQTLYEENLLLENDKTKLTSKETIREARAFFQKNLQEKALDEIDTEIILLLKKLKKRASGEFQYTHIFLDEFQDVSALELAIVGLIIKDVSQLTITGDSEQQTTESIVYTEAVQSLFAGIGSYTQNTSIYPLSISHRSTLDIMKFADALLGKTRTVEGRSGKPPLVIQCLTKSQGLKELTAWIKRVSDKFSGETILILTKNLEESKQLYSLLHPELKEGISLLLDAPRNTDGMVLVSSIQDCKGLEFPHVMIWDVSSQNYPDKNWARRRLYLAATRAEEHLALIYWGPSSPLLPPRSSKLYRLFDARPEDEEENQELLKNEESE